VISREHHGAFGNDRFGRTAERVARLFGTPQYIIGQTIAVICWIALNAVGLSLRWDTYPFVLLNLAFSTQAAYAAPLILLAQTRQADRDKNAAELAAGHRDGVASVQQALLSENTALTREIERLSTEIHTLVAEMEKA
jgi:uncharacterized membrane protein